MDITQILLCIIAGSTILNGLFMIFGFGYLAFQLQNIWEAEMVGLSAVLVDDESDISEEVTADQD